MFSMAVGTIGEWLKLVLFLLGDVQFRGGGGWDLKKKIMGWVPWKIKKKILHPSDSNRLYLKINGLCWS